MTDPGTDPAAVPRRARGQLLAAAILGVLGLLGVIAAVLYIGGGADYVRLLSGGHHGQHPFRLALALVAGVVLLAASGSLARS
jgi:hypothetical protein